MNLEMHTLSPTKLVLLLTVLVDSSGRHLQHHQWLRLLRVLEVDALARTPKWSTPPVTSVLVLAPQNAYALQVVTNKRAHSDSDISFCLIGASL